jgi:hypothetical protein
MKDKKIKRKIMSALALFGLLTFSLTTMITGNNNKAVAAIDNDPQVVQANVGQEFTFNVTSIGGYDTSNMNLNSGNTWFNSGQYKLTVITNNNTGYTVSVTHDNANLTGQGPLSGNIPGVTDGNALSNVNGWGLITQATQITPVVSSTYKTPSTSGNTIADETGPTPVTGTDWYLAYGVAAQGTTRPAAGSYKSTATMTATEKT